MLLMVRSAPSRPRHRGAALVEMALVLPLFLIVVIGMMEFAIMFLKDHGMSTACREAVRRLVVTPDSATRATEIQQIVCENLQTTLIQCPAQVTITLTPAARRGESSQVTLQSTQPFLTGTALRMIGLQPTVNLQKTCVMRDEAAPR